MRLVVTGHARHGKDTACEILRDASVSREYPLGLGFISSSLFCAEHARAYLAARGIIYQTLALCYADRGNHRPLWHDAILDYNMPDRTRLAREIFLIENRIYCGLRNREEFLAIKKECLFEMSIWIDASKRLPPEPEDSMQILPTDCDYIVDNNGSLEDLRLAVTDLYRHLQAVK